MNSNAQTRASVGKNCVPHNKVQRWFHPSPFHSPRQQNLCNSLPENKQESSKSTKLHNQNTNQSKTKPQKSTTLTIPEK
jgi:hypothetical protein